MDRRLPERLGRFQLASGVDHLGPPFPLGLGLPGHGPTHLVGQLDVFDLDHPDLDTPRLGAGVDPGPKLAADRLPLPEERVEIDLGR